MGDYFNMSAKDNSYKKMGRIIYCSMADTYYSMKDKP
jgi:hypothetical protein